MERKRSFPCYLDYKQHLELLTIEQCGELWLAMFDYAESGSLPDFSGALAMAFSFIRSQMDRDRAAYEEKCRKNAENGARGGRPSKTASNDE